MSDGKWLRHTLLGGVALGIASTGAQADELSALKTQLEALQNRVNQMEGTPVPTTFPGSESLVTFKRGQGSLSDWNTDRRSEGRMPRDSGFTIAVTPTADLPAPVTEVSISGYVKADVIYDFDQDSLGDTFGGAIGHPTDGINQNGQDTSGISLHAKQTRFRIRSRTGTAIGQIRTHVEGDFIPGQFRLRHAWGEWDMTPDWTFGAGQYWRIGCDVYTGVTTVDFGGSAGGCSSTRAAQVRITYTTGPMSLRFGIQEVHHSRTVTAIQVNDMPGTSPVAPGAGRSSPDFPNITAAVLYDVPGGHELFVGGSVEHVDVDGDESIIDDDSVTWEIQAGANVNLFDFATLTGHIQYGDGITNVNSDGVGNTNLRCATQDVDNTCSLDPNEVLGGYVGLSFDVTDTVQFNVQYGHANPKDVAVAGFTHASTVHTNIIWQPVRQMRLGWELMYGRKRNAAGFAENANRSAGRRSSSRREQHEDAWRGQFGAWFFF